MKSRGQWQAYIESGKDRREQYNRILEAPKDIQYSLIRHMRTVNAIKTFYENNKKK